MLSPRSDARVGEEESVPHLVGRLVDDGKQLIHAEVALYKAKAGERLTAYKGAAIFFAAAGALAFAGLIALLVGLILVLAPLIGPGGAVLAVVLGTLLIAGILAFVGKSKLAPPKVAP